MALTLIARAPDDLTDAEHLLRQTDAYWWWSVCLDRWGLPPERVDQWLLCREFTALQAAGIVADAYQRLARKHRHYFGET